jgi:hypothetical protein
MTPRVSFEADPLLVDAYQSLTGDEGGIGHFAVSWSEIALGPVLRDWEPLNLHVRNAQRSDVGLSVSFELLHGGRLDLPAYLLDLSWEHPDLLEELSRFMREFADRAQGTIRFLWLAEGPDRYARENPGAEPEVLAFYGALADTLGRIFPDTRLGVLIDPQEVTLQGGGSFVEALRDTLGSVALSIYPERRGDVAPEQALQDLEAAVAPWSGSPFSIVESGYRSNAPQEGDTGQSLYATLLSSWLFRRPATLELFCWSPVHDASSSLAASLADRRYPNDPAARDRYAAILSSAAVRRLDGSRKPARETYVDGRP